MEDWEHDFFNVVFQRLAMTDHADSQARKGHDKLTFVDVQYWMVSMIFIIIYCPF